MKKAILKSSLILLLFCFYAVSVGGEERTLDELGASAGYIASFQAEYVKSKWVGTEISQSKERIVFKRNIGFASYDDGGIKRIVNFLQGIDFTFNESERKVYKINYKFIPGFDTSDSRFVAFSSFDMLMPFGDGFLEAGSIQLKKDVLIGGKEFDLISAMIAKYPFLGDRCRIWQDRENRFIYKAAIYNKKDEPLLFLEVTEAEINPIIDDAEFSVVIPLDFKEIDITEQYQMRHRILTELYKVNSLSEQLKKINETLTAENELLKKKLEEKIVKEIEEELKKSPDLLKRISPHKYIKKEPSILVVDRKLKFVVIELGKDDGLVLGDVFDVYRDDKLLGKIQVTQVYEDMAVAEPVTPELMGELRERDKVVLRQLNF